MSLSIGAQPVPIKFDADGVARIGTTRVSLDTLVAAFQRGATAEEIVHRFDSLALADVYSVIAYYLHHHAEVDEYLQQRRLEANELRRSSDALIDRAAIRKRLLKRAASRRAP